MNLTITSMMISKLYMNDMDDFGSYLSEDRSDNNDDYDDYDGYDGDTDYYDDYDDDDGDDYDDDYDDDDYNSNGRDSKKKKRNDKQDPDSKKSKKKKRRGLPNVGKPVANIAKTGINATKKLVGTILRAATLILIALIILTLLKAFLSNAGSYGKILFTRTYERYHTNRIPGCRSCTGRL